jgi:hypothetical protein
MRYNSAGLRFQESRVVLNESAFKNGWDIVRSTIFMHKQGKTAEKMHIFQYLNGVAVHFGVRLRGGPQLINESNESVKNNVFCIINQ